jgi:hypothetical protein
MKAKSSLPKLATLAALVIVLSGPRLFSANLVQNPSFETPSVGNWYSYNPGGASWSFVARSGIVGYCTDWGSPVAPDGTQSAILQSADGVNSEISQAIGGFTVGQSYTVKFFASQRPGLFQNQDFNVLLDSTVLGHFQPSGPTFEEFTTASFTATATNHTLQFVALNSAGYTVNPNADNTAMIDNVRVEGASQVTVTYYMTGTVGAINIDNSFPPNLGPVIVGGPFTATFTLDLSAPVFSSGTNYAGYYQSVPPFSFTLSTGGLTVHSLPGSSPFLQIATPPTYVDDVFSISTGASLGLSSGWSSANVPYANFVFKATSGMPIPDVSLAQLPSLNLAEFDTTALSYFSLDFMSTSWPGVPPMVSFPGGSVSARNYITLAFLPTSLTIIPPLTNAGPTVVCSPPAIAECGATEEMTAAVSDPEGDPMVVIWALNGTAIQTNLVPAGSPGAVSNISLSGSFPLGTSILEITVTDGTNTASCSTTIAVIDTTPPSLTCPGGIVLEFQDEKGAVATYSVTATDVCSAASITPAPPSGSVFPIGVTPVQIQATDASTNSSHCTFDVTVLGARGVKSNILAGLVVLRGAVTKHFDAWELDEAIEDMIDALGLDNPQAPPWVHDAHRSPHCWNHHRHPRIPLWIDETHLNRDGAWWVFSQEKDTVKDLLEIMRSKKSTVPDATAQNLIDRIVKCDRLLAVVSNHDAASTGAKPKRLDQALNELRQGDQDAAAGRPAQAIEHYWRAWFLANYTRPDFVRGLDQ